MARAKEDKKVLPPYPILPRHHQWNSLNVTDEHLRRSLVSRKRRYAAYCKHDGVAMDEAVKHVVDAMIKKIRAIGNNP